MRGFSPNRWWVLVLTLPVFTACFFFLDSQVPPAAHADGGSGLFSVFDDKPPPPGVGDPDVPVGPGDGALKRTFVVRSEAEQVVSQDDVRPAGEGAVPSSVVIERLRLFLLSLRHCYLRY